MSWTARVLAWLGALAVVVVAAGWPVYVNPASDDPQAADVVYVIGPPTDARMDKALDLMEQGVADTLMVSWDPTVVRWQRVQEACGEQGDFADYTVMCTKPEPFTTRGEAQWLRDVAREHGWTSAAVITFTPHLSRTGVYMRRCFTGEVALVDSGESLSLGDWAYQYAYQTGAFLKAGLARGC